MTDYIAITAVAFALAGLAIVFRRGVVDNLLLLALIAAMPAALLLSGGSPGDLIPHAIAGLLALVVAVIGYFKSGAGGFWKGMAVLVFWLPTGLIVETLIACLIFGALLALPSVIAKSDSNPLLVRYTGLLFIFAAAYVFWLQDLELLA